MDVCCECCVLSGRGFCDELISRPEESYRLWYVVVFDLETSRMRRTIQLAFHPGANPDFVRPEAYTTLGPSLRKRIQITNTKLGTKVNIYLGPSQYLKGPVKVGGLEACSLASGQIRPCFHLVIVQTHKSRDSSVGAADWGAD